MALLFSSLAALVLMMLLTVSPAATAASPFVLRQLHIDMTLEEATSHIESLAGTCQLRPPRRAGDNITALCTLAPCRQTQQQCPAWQQLIATADAEGALQMRVGLEAAGANESLKRIAFLYDRPPGPIADSLLREYGTQDSGAYTDPNTDWSHSHRLGWVRGQYRMGFIYRPNMILLTRDQALLNSETSGVATPQR